MSVVSINCREYVERIRAGDALAGEALVQALVPLVQKIVGANLPWRSSPEDLCQEVFLKVFARLNQYAGLVPFEHWVARVAINTCRDQLRSDQRSKEIRWTDLQESEVEVLDYAASDWTTAETGDALAARDLADRLLASLSPDDRIVITLLDLENRTAAEVRELTGWSITSIRVRAFRARRKLRATLARLQKEGGRP